MLPELRYKLAFEGKILRITEAQDEALGLAFPWLNRQENYLKMDSWLVSHPEKRIKKHAAFAHNWLNREPRSNSPAPQAPKDIVFGVRPSSPESMQLLERKGI